MHRRKQAAAELYPTPSDPWLFLLFLSLVNQRGKKSFGYKYQSSCKTKKRDYLAFGSWETLVAPPPPRLVTIIRLSDCRTWKIKLRGECWLLSRRWRRCSVHEERSVRAPWREKNDSVGAGSEDWLILSPSLLSLCWSKSMAPRWQWTKPRHDRENRDRKRGQRN